jgi:hypothetical protein
MSGTPGEGMGSREGANPKSPIEVGKNVLYADENEFEISIKCIIFLVKNEQFRGMYGAK